MKTRKPTNAQDLNEHLTDHYDDYIPCCVTEEAQHFRDVFEQSIAMSPLDRDRDMALSLLGESPEDFKNPTSPLSSDGAQAKRGESNATMTRRFSKSGAWIAGE